MKFIIPENTKDTEGHYSAGVVSNGILFVSGQLSINPETGKIPEGGIAAEAKQALENLSNVLAAANLTLQNIIQCRIYIPDVGLWNDLNKVYSEFFGSHRPARIVVPSGNLYNGCLVEIEAVAECIEVK